MRKPPKPLDCKPGETVAWSAAFLKNTGQQTGNAGRERGTVLDRPDILGGMGPDFVVVHWKGRDEPSVVNRCNLARVGPNARFADAG